MSDDDIAEFINQFDTAAKDAERAFDDSELSPRAGDRDGGAGEGGGRYAPLDGAPTNGSGPIPELVDAAEACARKAGITLRRQAAYVAINPEFSKRLSDAYGEMAHAPDEPAVKEAHDDQRS